MAGVEEPEVPRGRVLAAARVPGGSHRREPLLVGERVHLERGDALAGCGEHAQGHPRRRRGEEQREEDVEGLPAVGALDLEVAPSLRVVAAVGPGYGHEPPQHGVDGDAVDREHFRARADPRVGGERARHDHPVAQPPEMERHPPGAEEGVLDVLALVVEVRVAVAAPQLRRVHGEREVRVRQRAVALELRFERTEGLVHLGPGVVAVEPRMKRLVGSAEDRDVGSKVAREQNRVSPQGRGRVPRGLLRGGGRAGDAQAGRGERHDDDQRRECTRARHGEAGCHRTSDEYRDSLTGTLRGATLEVFAERAGRSPRRRFSRGGKSGLQRAACWLTASGGDPRESATENTPPNSRGKPRGWQG